MDILLSIKKAFIYPAHTMHLPTKQYQLMQIIKVIKVIKVTDIAAVIGVANTASSFAVRLSAMRLLNMTSKFCNATPWCHLCTAVAVCNLCIYTAIALHCNR